MEKISRIIPPSARTKSYDVARAQPVRPGAPSLGRPDAPDLFQDRMTISDQLIEPIMNGETLSSIKTPQLNETYKPKDMVKSQLIKEMTNNFFLKQSPKEVAKESNQSQSEELAARAQSSAGSSVNPDSSKEMSL